MSLRKHFGFLASRKVRVGLATIAASFLAQYGFNVSEEIMLAILGVGASIILGIAHEDNGAKTQNITSVSVAEPGNVQVEMKQPAQTDKQVALSEVRGEGVVK